eukprot:7384439-Prymnesium_polylepis.1
MPSWRRSRRRRACGSRTRPRLTTIDAALLRRCGSRTLSGFDVRRAEDCGYSEGPHRVCACASCEFRCCSWSSPACRLRFAASLLV